jgi:microcin C transport system substrate-binding protein
MKLFKQIICMTFLVCPSISVAKTTTALSLYGKPKYDENFKHYEHVNPKAPKGGKLTMSAVGSFDSLNPFVIKGTPAGGLVPLYSGLFYVTLLQHSLDEVFTEQAYLAEKMDLAEDHLSITFYLRPDAKFHDGTPIQAADVVFSFETLLKEGSPLYKQYYGDVAKVEQVDDLTLTFIFKHARNRELPLLLGQFPIFSKAHYTKNKFDSSSLKTPLGNGPYEIVKVEPGHSITYRRVKNWWGVALPINVGRYNFDEIEYIYFRDPEVAFQGFKSHAYDLRIENRIKNWVTGYDFDAVKSGHVMLKEIPLEAAGVMQGLTFNTRRPLFTDRRVREALQYALDFEWINENYFYNKYDRTTSYFWGTSLASSGLISEEEKTVLDPFKKDLPPEIFTQAYVPPKTDGKGTERGNLKRAEDLLKAAGWEIKDNVLVNTQTGKPFTFELLMGSSDLARPLGSFISALKRLGIKVNVRVVDTAQYVQRVHSFDFDMIPTVTGQSLCPGNEQRELWSSAVATVPGSQNYAGIKDPVVDKLIEQLIKQDDYEHLTTYTKALDRVLLWGYYVIPLWYSSDQRLAYWDTLTNTGKFSRYGVDLMAWWSQKQKEE